MNELSCPTKPPRLFRSIFRLAAPPNRKNHPADENHLPDGYFQHDFRYRPLWLAPLAGIISSGDDFFPGPGNLLLILLLHLIDTGAGWPVEFTRISI